jgi:phage terminase large subunit-like protein
VPRRRTDRTTNYAELVTSGQRLTGHTEFLACQRHLRDLKRRDFDYIFDVREAEKFISIANELTIGEGAHPKKLQTRGFQNFILGSLFGWRKKRSKERRFREAYIQIARQNGKSFLAGAIANMNATFAGYNMGNIYCAATKQDQANIVWDEIYHFILSDPDLAELYEVTKYAHKIRSKVTDTVIKAIGRDTKSADGFRSILAIIDEYHAHKTDQMYKLMLDGQIKVPSALTLAITTAGFDLNSPCYKQYEFCKKILSGAVQKDSQFVYITEMDENDDVWDYHNWAKANPLNLWKDDVTLDEEMIGRYAQKAIDAKEKGGDDLVNFETKSLNTWVTYTGGAVFDAEKWAKCASDLAMADMKNRECYLGIDLSSGGDLTSLSFLFPLDNADGKEQVFLESHSFMPTLRLQEHEKTDKVPYRQWVRDGLMTLTDGGYGIKTDYKYIIQYLKNLIGKYGIKIIEVGYDPHNASAFLEDLDFLGCDLTDIIQSARSLSDTTKDLQLSVEAGVIKYNRKNALLTWSIINAIETQNSFGEIKIDKNTLDHRIDPVDAAIDAWKLYFMRKQSDFDQNAAVDEWAAAMNKMLGDDDKK